MASLNSIPKPTSNHASSSSLHRGERCFCTFVINKKLSAFAELITLQTNRTLSRELSSRISFSIHLLHHYKHHMSILSLLWKKNQCRSLCVFSWIRTSWTKINDKVILKAYILSAQLYSLCLCSISLNLIL